MKAPVIRLADHRAHHSQPTGSRIDPLWLLRIWLAYWGIRL